MHRCRLFSEKVQPAQCERSYVRVFLDLKCHSQGAEPGTQFDEVRAKIAREW